MMSLKSKAVSENSLCFAQICYKTPTDILLDASLDFIDILMEGWQENGLQ